MTDAEHRDAAWQALIATTISYPEWVRRRDTGKYPDITATKWWQAFDHLAKIADDPEPPPPPPPPSGRTPLPPVGPFVTRTTEQFFRDGDGLLTEKVYVDFTPTTGANTAGIGNMRWPYTGASTGTWVLKDCKVRNVSDIPPRDRDGTGEAGFWIGEKTQGERLEAWNNAWMNMVTLAACKGSRFIDVDLHDNPHVGLYMEHVSTDVEFRRSSFGGSRLGVQTDSSSINVEWWYADTVYGPTLPYGGKAGSYGCRFIDCDIYCPRYTGQGKPYEVNGAFLDAGTFGFLFQNCRFWGPGNAIGLPNRLVDSSQPNRVVDCVFENQGLGVTYHDNVIG